ncbi:MAG: hypothetical protein ABI980_10145 [Nitrospirota bacterium]
MYEKNLPKIWAQMVQNIRRYLVMFWFKKALQGRPPEEAFFIRCDRTTMTPADLRDGALICLVGMALVRPSEFATFRIRMWFNPRP